jgi:glycosyltransferase involved in cell wall biosynthesis
VIPNGVDLEKFKPAEKSIALRAAKFKKDKNIIFVSDINSKVKNYDLAKRSVAMLGRNDLDLHVVTGVLQDELSYYYSAADLLILTSLWEGSPNVIKEAMACNCPIVSTDVGDVKEIISGVPGCYITSFDPKDIAEKIKSALDYGKRTSGRMKIRDLEIGIVSEKIHDVYKRVMQE